MRSTLELGAQLDTLDRGELRSELAAHAQERYQQFARGIKYLRFGPFTTPIASNAFSLDGTGAGQNRSIGPREGFIWSVRRITVTGLTTGTTPDVANLFRGNPSGIPVWQFNGNNFAYTFGKTELLLLAGEVLSLANQGNITATGNVTISGDLLEVPAEEIFKLL